MFIENSDAIVIDNHANIKARVIDEYIEISLTWKGLESPSWIPTTHTLAYVHPIATPKGLGMHELELHKSRTLADGLVYAFVESSRITTSVGSKKAGIEMHRVASDRSWP